MSFIDSVYAKAKENRRTVAIPECTNETMARAAYKAARDGIADIVFIGEPGQIKEIALRNGIDLSLVKIVDINDAAYKEKLVDRFFEASASFMGRQSVLGRMQKPLYAAMVMEAVGDVDATFAGLDTTTGEVVMAASAIIGLGEGVACASCFFAAELKSFKGQEDYVIAMSDGGVLVDPTPEQLASVAISCSDTYRALTGNEARCAMLSFSTDGSGSGPQVDKVVKGRDIARRLRPDLKIDGEFQVDAALMEKAAAKKIKRESEVAGNANVLVFPNIEACNIGSKLVQLTAECNTYGPILQGFRLPVCDCSRSDTEERLYTNIACSCVLAGYKK